MFTMIVLITLVTVVFVGALDHTKTAQEEKMFTTDFLEELYQLGRCSSMRIPGASNDS